MFVLKVFILYLSLLLLLIYFFYIVPYLAPEMTSSSFDVENSLGNRTVTVYWKVSIMHYDNYKQMFVL